MNTQPTYSHPLLPPGMDSTQLENYIRKYAPEKYQDELKHFYSQEDINDMARQSAAKGNEIIQLQNKLEDCKSFLNKGWSGEKSAFIEIPPTAGIAALQKNREKLDTDIARGYFYEPREVFGLYYDEQMMMVFFDSEGNEIKSRNRAYTEQEKRDRGGLFLQIGNG